MKFISHRGASWDLPENTIPAFLLAKKAGFEYFETDVQMTKDKVLVACHDYDLKRLSNSAAKIADLTFVELSKFDVAIHFKDYKRKLSVPSLAEIFDVLGSDAKICLEIKNKANLYPDIHKHILQFIAQRKTPLSNIFVSSFDYETLQKTKSLNSQIPIGVLCKKGDTPNCFKKALMLKAASINIHYSDALQVLVTKAHQHGLKVLVYTVNDRKILSKLSLLGIDGVFTDRIDLH